MQYGFVIEDNPYDYVGVIASLKALLRLSSGSLQALLRLY
jgi:hypothetical protein